MRQGTRRDCAEKGHRDFVVIVTARLKNGQIAILGVLPDREKITVTQFLKGIPPSLSATIHTLCTDMYESYIQAVREALSHVRIVIDRFHVAKKCRDAADTVRKQELKRLKQELPKTEYQQLKLSCFDDFLNTLDRWWNEITNYFINRDSSGSVEDLNNKLKILNRRCYGLLNVGHLFQRIFLDLEGHRLFARDATRCAEYHGNSQ